MSTELKYRSSDHWKWCPDKSANKCHHRSDTQNGRSSCITVKCEGMDLEEEEDPFLGTSLVKDYLQGTIPFSRQVQGQET